MSADTILFITDTHAGPERPGWSQQTCCLHFMPRIADGVEYDETKAWVSGQPGDRTVEIPL